MDRENTLLGRCTVAYGEAVDAFPYPGHTWRTRRVGTAAVLEHIAAEIIVEQQRRKLTAHDVAELLRSAAMEAQ